MPHALTAAAAIVVLLAPVAAHAQVEEDTGYLGKRRLRLEVDDCGTTPAIDEQALRATAGEHYDRGGVLYLQGDYDGAVREFVSCICLVPTFTVVLKSIGQAYERLLEYDRAIAYYERYVLTTDDAQERRSFAERIEVLRALPARIRVATTPPGADVSLTDEGGVRRSLGRSGEEPYEVVAGRYTMTVTLDGHETIERVIDPAIGQPYSYFFQLTPERGALRINAEPADARIFVDDRLVGIGRYEEQLPGGRYKVTVEAQGRVADTRVVEVVADGAADVAVRLPPRPASGRRQLIVGGTVGGGLLGSLALGVLEDGNEGRAGLGFAGGLAVGFVGSYLGVPDDIEVGESSYIITTSLIGATEAALVTSLIEREGVDAVGPVTVGGMALGATFAALTADRFSPSAGDAALLNSGALWGAIGGGLFAAVFQFRQDVSEGLVLGGLNLGVVTGVLVGRQVDYSRRHVALIDLAGLAGMGVAVSLQSVIDNALEDDAAVDGSNDGGTERTAHFALAGMATGLALGAFLTRNLDAPKLKNVTPVLQTGTDEAGAKTTVFGVGGVF